MTGAAGIECRSGGANNDYQVVLTFANPLAGVNGVRVSDGTATVSHSAIGADPRQYVVDLTGVANAQTITLSLVGVNDGISIGDVSVPMSVLIGDTSASRVVSNTDVAAVKGQVGAPVNAANFRTDVNGNGVLSNSDVSAVKTQAGTTLP